MSQHQESGKSGPKWTPSKSSAKRRSRAEKRRWRPKRHRPGTSASIRRSNGKFSWAGFAVDHLKRLHGNELKASPETSPALEYLDKHRAYMNYACLRQNGYHIDTSHMEAVPRLLVVDAPNKSACMGVRKTPPASAPSSHASALPLQHGSMCNKTKSHPSAGFRGFPA